MSNAYGKGKAPERACMKLKDWPARHREPWLASLQGANPIDGGGGSRTVQRPITNHGIEKSYGRFLTFLDRRGLLDPTIDPADLITPTVVRDYVLELESCFNKPGTIHVRLEHLREMAKVFAPDRDSSFIAREMARVHAQRHDRDPFSGGRPVLSGELVDLGLGLMEEARQKRNEVRYLGQYRDGLLIAFLALVPIRLRNLADLVLGRTLIKVGNSWIVRFPPETTKTHRTLEYEWPIFLVPALQEYLTTYRPLLIQRDGRWNCEAGESLWVSLDGSPMSFGSITYQLACRTRIAFGYPLRAHAFRHAATTTLAISDPTHVLAAAPLLGHASFSTTERSYNVAKSLEASRAFAAVTIRPPSSRRKSPMF